MKKSITYQQDFTRGIIENFKQDNFKEIRNSALLIENYDPNIEYGSLVKRSMWSDYDRNKKDIIDGDFNVNYLNNDSGINNDYELSNLSSIVNLNHYDINIPFVEKIILQNLSAFYSSNPYSLKNFIVFFIDRLNNNPVLRLLANTFEHIDDYTVKELWRENHSEPFWNPGWIPRGYFGDDAVYGENLIFVTTPNDIHQNIIKLNQSYKNLLYPAYRYYRWDRTEYRGEDGTLVDQYWNGIDIANITNKQLNSRWIVKHPAQSLLKENIGVSYIPNNKTPEVIKDTETKAVLANPRDMEFIFHGYSLTYHKYLENETQSIIHNEVRNPGNGVFSVNSNKIYKVLNNKFKYITTGEIPKFAVTENNQPYPYKFYSTQGGGGEGHGDSIFVWGGPSIRYVNTKLGDIYKIFWLGLENYSGYDLTYALSFNLIDYIDAKLPRPFMKKEEIPYVITAIVDGVELFLYDGLYEIENGNEFLYPAFIDNINDKIQETNHFILNVGYGISHKNIFEWGAQNLDNLEIGNDRSSWEDRDRENFLAASDSGRFYGGNIHENHEGFGSLADPFFTCAEPFQHIVQSIHLRLTPEMVEKLEQANVTSLRMYISKPSNESNLRSVGIRSYEEPPLGIYSKPIVDKSVYNNKKQKIENEEEESINELLSNYGLAKEWLIKGEGTYVETYDRRQENFYDGMQDIKTNAWREKNTDIFGSRAFWAMPQATNNISELIKYPEAKILEGYTAYTPVNHAPVEDPMIEEVLPVVNPQIDHDGFLGFDNVIWDYPTTRDNLSLNSSGNYWQGLGAKAIIVVKGRTFLFGTINKDGKEEQGIVRYSQVQNGIASFDIFPEENQLRMGHNPLTAGIEFREQLLSFSRNTMYRMAIHNAFLPEEWELLETIQGQGTFSPKTLCVTPYGVCYANETGIWLTDGGMPMSLTNTPEKGLAVNGIYTKLMQVSDSMYLSNYNAGNYDVGSKTEEYNAFAELYYVKEKDELILYTPFIDPELQRTLLIDFDINSDAPEEFNCGVYLIYNFRSKNWRTEKQFYLQSFGDNTAQPYKIQAYSIKGRSKNENVSWFGYDERGQSNWKNKLAIKDKNNGINDDDKYLFYPTTVGGYSNPIEYQITGTVITHHIGNGEDDSSYRKVILECVPKEDMKIQTPRRSWQQYNYDINSTTRGQWRDDLLPYTTFIKDPSLIVLTRNKSFSPYSVPERANTKLIHEGIDLVKRNMIPKSGIAQNPWKSKLQTPNSPKNAIPDFEKIINNESLALLAPLNLLFRQSQIVLISSIIVKVGSIRIEYTEAERRTQ